MKKKIKRIVAVLLAFAIILQQDSLAGMAIDGMASADEILQEDLEPEIVEDVPEDIASESPANPGTDAVEESSTDSGTDAAAENSTDSGTDAASENPAEPQITVDEIEEVVQTEELSLPEEEPPLPVLKLDNSAQISAGAQVSPVALELTRAEGFPKNATYKMATLKKKIASLTAGTAMNQAKGLALRFSIELDGNDCDLTGTTAVLDGLDASYLTGGHLSLCRDANESGEGKWEELAVQFSENGNAVRASFSVDSDGVLFFWKDAEVEAVETEEVESETMEAAELETTETETEAAELETMEAETAEPETAESEMVESEIAEPETAELEMMEAETAESETMVPEPVETETETETEAVTTKSEPVEVETETVTETDFAETEFADETEWSEETEQGTEVETEAETAETEPVKVEIETVPEANLTETEIVSEGIPVEIESEIVDEIEKETETDEFVYDLIDSPDMYNLMQVAEAGEDETKTFYEVFYKATGKLVFQTEKPVGSEDYVIYTDNGSNAKNSESAWPFHEVRSQIQSVEFLDDVPMTSMDHIFSNCRSLTEVNTNYFTAKDVTSLGSAFFCCDSLISLNLSNWDTSSVTYMSYAFKNCSELTELDVSTWNTSSVTDLQHTFRGCSRLKNLDLRNWVINAAAKNLQQVFYDCKELTALDLSKWDTKNADMNQLFSGCTSLSQLKLGEKFVFKGGTNLDGFWRRETTRESYTVDQLVSSYNNNYNSAMADIYHKLIPITFNVNGGSSLNSTIDSYVGDVLTAEEFAGIPTPIRAGYEFAGWWTDPDDGEGEELTEEGTITQTEYYAHWEKCTVYEIFYKKTGELVFQNTDDVDPAKVTSPIETDVQENEEYKIYNDDGSNVFDKGDGASEADWAFHEIRGRIKSVTFRDNVKLRTLRCIFSKCSLLAKVNTGIYDASGVTHMGWAFSGCENLTSLDLSKWDTSSVTYLGRIFQNCKNLHSLNLSGWKTDNVQNLFETFQNCESLTAVDVSGWNTARVNNMISTFSGCKSLTELDLSGWTTSSVSAGNMNYIFKDCSALSRLTWESGFQLKNASAGLTGSWQREGTQEFYTADQMMNNVAGAGTYIRPRVYEILYTSGEMVIQNDDETDPSKGEVYRIYEDDGSGALSSDANNDTWEFDADRSRITSVTFRDKDVKLKTLRSIFKGCTNLEEVDIGAYDASGVTSLGWAFSGCENLTSLDLSGWDTSSVTYMGRIFQNCRKLSSLNISGWNTDNVNNLYQTFQNCESLTALDDIRTWNTANVTNMIGTFAGCSSLKELHLSAWDCQAVTSENNMENMFQNCTDLVQLDLGPQFQFINTNAGLTGEWKRGSNDQKYDAAVLMESYKKATASDMADSYYRAARITFNGNGGVAAPQGIDGYLNMVLDDLPTAEREGYEFLGWFTKRSDGDELKKGDKVAQLTYYAHWKPYTYTLRLHGQNGLDGEAGIKTETLTFDQFYQLSETLFTNGEKLLIGWNTKSNGQGKMYEPNARVSGLADQNGSEVTLYAIWGNSDDYATLTFDSRGGSSIPPMRFQKGERVQHLPQPTREGYQFDCWAYREDGGLKLSENGFVEMTEDITLYAQWLPYFTATFDAEGVDATTVQATEKTPLGSLPKLPQRADGSTLIGWFAEDGTQAIAGKTCLKANTVFHARWGWKPQFDAAGGEFVSGGSTPAPNYDYVESKDEASQYMLESLPEVRRDGYAFTGWYLADGTKVEAGRQVDLTTNMRLIAHWEPISTVQIQLDPNGGTIDGKKEGITLNGYSGMCLGDLPVPERAGYVFMGWFDEENTLYDRNKEFTAGKTLTAHWVEEVYVTFVSEGNVVERIPVAKDETISVLPGAKKTGDTKYVLEGWYTDLNDVSTKLTTGTPISEDTTYYAKWVPLYIEQNVGNIKYTYGVEWNSASNENVDHVGDSLVFHPTDTAEQTAQLHVRFESNMETQDGVTLPVGAVRIRIPKQVWKNWDEEPTGSCNIGAELQEHKEGIELSGKSYFTYMEDPTDPNFYILINDREITGGAGVDLLVSYTVDPTSVPGGGIDAVGNYVDGPRYYQGKYPVTITIDTDNNDTPEETIEKELSIEMHTRVRTSAAKEFSKIRYSYMWQKEWGPAPEDADDYFYIEWKLKETVQSTTNQPFIFTWSEENTVHDGTVVGITKPSTKVTPIGYQTFYNDQKVVVKYPLSMLKDAKDGKLTLHNEAVVTEKWDSGYETSHRVSANYTVEVPISKGGEAGFEKISFNTTNNASVHAPAQKHGGQEDILDDGNEVPLGWRISYGGGPEDIPGWDDVSGTYSTPVRTICITDGTEENLMYSSGSNADEKYNWVPSSDNITLSDEDYRLTLATVTVTEYDAACLDEAANRWTDKKEHLNRSDYGNVDIYVRRKNSDQLEFFRSIPCDDAGKVTVALPEYARGIKILHNSEFYWTDIRVDLTANLLPSNTITRLFREDVKANTTSIIKNWSHCKVWTDGQNEENAYVDLKDYDPGKPSASAVREVWELDVSVTDQFLCKSATNESGVVVDVRHGIQDNPMCLTGWLHNNSNRLKQLRTGEFYDLLPMGTTVDPSSVYGVSFEDRKWGTPGAPGIPANNYYTKMNDSGRLPNSALDVSFENNWEGSHRTMMIVRFTIPENVKANGVHIYFLLRTTYENIMENGSTQENDAAFINTTKSSSPPRDTGVKLDELNAKEYFRSLDKKYSGTISYYEASAHYAPVDVSTWGFDKQVKAETSTSYSQKDTSLLNNLYTYRLTYSQGSGTRTKGIVFFDVLEYGFYEKAEDQPGFRTHVESDWQGAFVDINVEAVRENRMDKENPETACDPVIYYSWKLRGDIPDAKPNFNDKTIWSTTPPVDEEITAIAVDCSKCKDGSLFELKGDDSVMEIYITMRAPKEVILKQDTARNRAAVYMTHVDSKLQETSVMMDAGASVTLQDVEPELHKKADPGSGTKEKPAAVYKDDPLTYTLSVVNVNKELPLKDVVLTDTIPGRLSVQNADIRVRFGDDMVAMPVSESPRVGFVRDGQNLRFTIRNLYAGETAYVEITGTVTADAGTVLENHAEIPSVNGVEKEIQSEETTYHKVEPIGFSISKVGAGGRPLEGAKLGLWKLKDGKEPNAPLNGENYTLVEGGKWTTDGNVKRFDDLAEGAGIYLIHEAEAPAGHLLAEDITVKLDNQGNLWMDDNIIHGVTMQDDYTRVQVEKKDRAANDIVGAELEIYRSEDFDMKTTKEPLADKTPVAHWITNGRPYELDGILDPKTSYVLYEKTAPEGYLKAEPIGFYLGEGKTLLQLGMIDPFASFELRVRKEDPEGRSLAGAKLRIEGVRNTDTGTEHIEPIEWYTTVDDEALKLYPGTYTLSEVYAPDGYAVAEPIEFKVEENPGSTDGIAKVTVNGEPVEAATLVMTDKRTQDLIVTKTVQGNNPDDASGSTGKKKYQFTLKLTESGTGKLFDRKLAYEISGGADTVSNVLTPVGDGLYKFELAHGERITLFDVPEDFDYVVSEIPEDGANYVATIDDETGGTTGADAPARVNVTNTYPDNGDLLISKNVVGTWAPEGESYTVEITPGPGDGASGNIGSGVEVYKMSSGGGMSSVLGTEAKIEANKITVSLKDGEQLLVKKLAYGTYTVKEIKEDVSGEVPGTSFTASYKVDGKGSFEVKDGGTEVTVDAEKMGSVEVRNTYSDLGELTVGKSVVEGSGAPKDVVNTWYEIRVSATASGAFRNYRIEIIEDPAGGIEVGSSPGGAVGSTATNPEVQELLKPSVENGILRFRLRKDCKVKISGLPVGKYTVAETDVGGGCKASYTAVADTTKNSTTSGVVTLGGETTAGERITSGEVKILNRYPDEISMTLTGTKAVIGREAVENKYHFAIEAVKNPGNGATMSATEDIVNTGGQIDFGTISFTKTGTYVFKVWETRSDDIEVGTDGTAYMFTVTVAIKPDDKSYACEITKVVFQRQPAGGGETETVATYVKSSDEEAGSSGVSGESAITGKGVKPIPTGNKFELPERTEEEATATFINRVKHPLKMPDTGGPGAAPLTRTSILLCLAGCFILLLAKRRKPRGSF